MHPSYSLISSNYELCYNLLFIFSSSHNAAMSQHGILLSILTESSQARLSARFLLPITMLWLLAIDISLSFVILNPWATFSSPFLPPKSCRLSSISTPFELQLIDLIRLYFSCHFIQSVFYREFHVLLSSFYCFLSFPSLLFLLCLWLICLYAGKT